MGAIGHAPGLAGSIRLWVLVLAVAAGLIGMHHLMAPGPTAHGPAGAGLAPAAVSMTAMTGPEPVSPPTPGMPRTSDGLGAAPAGSAVNAVTAPVLGSVAGSAMDMLMHPCLAVLAALLVLAPLAAVLLALARRHDPSRAARLGLGVSWARPPPRTAVRLALLCVLRN